jgi:cytochrome P450
MHNTTTVTSETLRPIPVHPGLPILGNSLEIARDPLGAFTRLQAQHLQPNGPRLIQVAIGGRRQYVTFKPEDAKHVLQENHRNYVRSPAFKILEIFLGKGLLTNDGDHWRQQRRLAQPAFHRQKLAVLGQIMQQEVTVWLTELSQLNLDKPVNLSEKFMDITMRIVCKTLFGTDAGNQLVGISHAMETAIFLANKRLMSPISPPMSWPTPDNLRYHKAARTVDALIYSIIEGRKKTGERRDDLLDMLLYAEDEDTGQRMTTQQLRDECVTLFAAGHETTAVSMAWTTYLLTKHPDILAKLVASLPNQTGSYGGYPAQVIQESLRLYPPAWATSRFSVNDDQIGPHRIPANSTVLVLPYLLHRNPEQWPNPNQFDPERFAAENQTERHSYSHLPFGGGPRLCIGNMFALMEMQMLLTGLAQNFQLEAANNTEIAPSALLTLRPGKAVMVKLKPRN